MDDLRQHTWTMVGVFRLPALAIVIGPSVWPVSSEIANTASRPWSCAHWVKRRCHSRAAAFDPKRTFMIVKFIDLMNSVKVRY